MQNLEHSANSPGVAAPCRQVVRRLRSGVAVLPALAASALLAACSGESDSEQGATGGSSSSITGGSSGASSNRGGSANTGGTASTGGSANTGGSTNTGGSVNNGGKGGASTAGGNGSCAARPSVTIGVHAVIPVTWPGTLGTQAGSGDFHSWTRLTMTAAGTALSGRSSPCGSTLPPLMLTVLVGGGMSLVEIPTTLWDTPSFPDFPSSGTLSGWSSGATLKTNSSATLIGSSMADPEAAWPKASTDVTPVDSDDDGNPGIASIPRMGGGYNPPPVSIVGPRAQRIDITSRTALALDGALDSCTDLSGTARLERLDSHVLGCERDDGEPCTAAQTDFLDDNRTLYTTKPGTFTAKIIEAGATCAAIREALPM